MTTDGEARRQLKKLCAELAAARSAIEQGMDRLPPDDDLRAEVAQALPDIDVMSLRDVQDLARRVLEAIPVRPQPATAKAARGRIFRRRSF